MNDSKKLVELTKEDLVSSLLGLKFSGNIKGGALCEGCTWDVCSNDPCCDGGSQCSNDYCSLDVCRG